MLWHPSEVTAPAIGTWSASRLAARLQSEGGRQRSGRFMDNADDAWRRVIASIRAHPDQVIKAVAIEVGEPPAVVRRPVETALRMLANRAGRAKAESEFRRAGAAAAREGVPPARLFDRYASSAWAIWDAASTDESLGRRDLQDFGAVLMRGLDLAAAAFAEGYAEVDREVVARDAGRRRALFEELVTTPPLDRLDATRRRRLADRHGLDPDGAYRLIALSNGRRSSELKTMQLATKVARILASEAPDDASRRVRLPWVSEWRGWAVVIAAASGSDDIRTRFEAQADPSWIAVRGSEVRGVASLADAMIPLRDTLRTAEQTGRRGWIADPNELALETMLTLDQTLLRRTVDQELGAILSDERMGRELIETLRVYFEAGENVREAGRRLHLAARTVSYRLQRATKLMGRPLDGASRERIAVALYALRYDGRYPQAAEPDRS